MIKVLVIGCGNIGSQYDMDSDEILTHVKAWSLIPDVALSIADSNIDVLRKVASKYKCEIASDIKTETLREFDCLSICTPTYTHREILENAFAARVKMIICEKPISTNMKDVKSLLEMYSESDSRVLVNYIRRFQPEYEKLKEFIKEHDLTASLTNISIRYQRGFINNCSHAFDLIEYLLESEIVLEDVKLNNKVYDHFDHDPTLSMMAIWNSANFSVIGLSNVLFSHFEIDLYFKVHKICIRNAGQKIDIYETKPLDNNITILASNPVYSKENCLKDYMKYVIGHACLMINDVEMNDNFISSANLNQRMLNYIKN